MRLNPLLLYFSITEFTFSEKKIENFRNGSGENTEPVSEVAQTLDQVFEANSREFEKIKRKVCNFEGANHQSTKRKKGSHRV